MNNKYSITLAVLLIPLLVVTTPMMASQDTGSGPKNVKPLDFPVTRITDRIYVIYGPFALPDEKNRGFRNNPVIILTSEGVVVCDPGGSAAAGEMVVEKVKTLTDKPIVAVFISHAHGDHWLGNEAIVDAYPEVTIYGHAAMKAKVGSGDGHQWLDIINRVTKKSANGTRVVNANRTVDDGDIIYIGGLTFQIHHTGTAHTEGDIMVEIVEEEAIFLGDVVRNRFLGIMESDSSFRGNIEAINYLLDKKADLKYYIPGHGKVSQLDMLKDYRAYLSTVLDGVKNLYSSGMADFEMKSRIVNRMEEFRTWEGFELRVGAHISQAFLEVEAEDF